MTNASAMLLVLVVFLAMFIGAMFVILWGGGLFRHHRSLRHHDDMNHDHRAAA